MARTPNLALVSRDAEIRRRRRAGEAVKAIAGDLGLTTRTVNKICDLPKKEKTDVEKRRQAIADYYRDGASVRDTMAEFKCGQRMVKACVDEAGYELRWKNRRPSMTPARHRRALALFKQGRSRAWIADKMGVCATTIANSLVKQGVEPGDGVGEGDWPSTRKLKADNKKAARDAWTQPLTTGASMMADIGMPTDRIAVNKGS